MGVGLRSPPFLRPLTSQALLCRDEAKEEGSLQHQRVIALASFGDVLQSAMYFEKIVFFKFVVLLPLAIFFRQA